MQTLSAPMGTYHLLCALWWLQGAKDTQPSQRHFRSHKWKNKILLKLTPLAPLFFMTPSFAECGEVVWLRQPFQPLQAAVMTLSGTLSGLLQDCSLRGVLLLPAPRTNLPEPPSGISCMHLRSLLSRDEPGQPDGQLPLGTKQDVVRRREKAVLSDHVLPKLNHWGGGVRRQGPVVQAGAIQNVHTEIYQKKRKLMSQRNSPRLLHEGCSFPSVP